MPGIRSAPHAMAGASPPTSTTLMAAMRMARARRSSAHWSLAPHCGHVRFSERGNNDEQILPKLSDELVAARSFASARCDGHEGHGGQRLMTCAESRPT